MTKQDTRQDAAEKYNRGSGTACEVRSSVKDSLLKDLREEANLRRYPRVVPLVERMLQEDPIKRISVRQAINHITSAFSEMTISVFLNMLFEEASMYQKLVIKTLVKAIAAALGLSEKAVRDLGVRRGSVVVDLLLPIPRSGAEKAIDELRRMLRDPNSVLRQSLGLVGRLITKIELFHLPDSAAGMFVNSFFFP